VIQNRACLFDAAVKSSVEAKSFATYALPAKDGWSCAGQVTLRPAALWLKAIRAGDEGCSVHSRVFGKPVGKQDTPAPTEKLLRAGVRREPVLAA
jgi:hypothetical protein